jgi:fatty acid desaturase
MRRFVYRSLAMNLGLLLLLWLFGHAWLYLLWVVAFMTSHMLVSRIRQIGEHAAVPDLFSLDPRDNTRTVKINWLERFFIAPHGVSYHLEHHLLSSVPVYRLRRLHELLRRKGFYKDTEFPEGYLDMLRQVTYPG